MKNRIYSAFDQIHAEDALKQKTMKSVLKNIEKRERRLFVRRKYAYALSAIMLFLCVGLGSHQLYFTEVFALSVDVNPSIELGINRFDRVISVDGYNEDGEQILSSVDAKYKNYKDAVDCIVEEEQRQGYLVKNDEVSITVNCSEDEKYQEVKDTISTCQIQEQQEVLVEKCPEETVTKAHDYGLSFGKYQAFQKLQEVKPEVTVDEVKTMTMNEIKTATLESSDVVETPTDSSIAASSSGNTESVDTTAGSTTNSSAGTASTTDSSSTTSSSSTSNSSSTAGSGSTSESTSGSGATTNSSSTTGSGSTTSSSSTSGSTAGSNSATSSGSTTGSTAGSNSTNSNGNSTSSELGDKITESTSGNKDDKVDSNKDNTGTDTSAGSGQTVVDGSTTTENTNESGGKPEQNTESKPLVPPEVREDAILGVNKN